MKTRGREGERERVRKTQREIPNTNVETLQTEQHMFWSADVDGGSKTHMTTP